MRLVRGLVALVAAMLVLALAACGQSHDGDKYGDMELRTELEPLASRVPELAGADGAVWMSGTMGDPSVPGPSLYWIDAVVDLGPETLELVKSDPTLAVRPLSSDLVRGLVDQVPPGDLLASDGLNGDLSSADWKVEAWFAPDTGQLVVLMQGE